MSKHSGHGRRRGWKPPSSSTQKPVEKNQESHIQPQKLVEPEKPVEQQFTIHATQVTEKPHKIPFWCQIGIHKRENGVACIHCGHIKQHMHLFVTYRHRCDLCGAITDHEHEFPKGSVRIIRGNCRCQLCGKNHEYEHKKHESVGIEETGYGKFEHFIDFYQCLHCGNIKHVTSMAKFASETKKTFDP